MKADITGPYTFNNLAIFLFHSVKQNNEIEYIDFNSGINSRILEIIETEKINQLIINNNSDKCAYIQYGDIVEGGMQDRAILSDVFIPSKSTSFKVPTNCIEQNRWNYKGDKSNSIYFNYPNKAIYHSKVREALLENNQTRVWNEISRLKSDQNIQSDLRQSHTKSSSYFNYLQESKINTNKDDYVKEFNNLVLNNPDSIGFGYYINGQPNGIDLYYSNMIFLMFWTKLIDCISRQASMNLKSDILNDSKLEVSSFQKFVMLLKKANKKEISTIEPRTRFIKKEDRTNNLIVNETIDLEYNERIRLNAFTN